MGVRGGGNSEWGAKGKGPLLKGVGKVPWGPVGKGTHRRPEEEGTWDVIVRVGKKAVCTQPPGSPPSCPSATGKKKSIKTHGGGAAQC